MKLGMEVGMNATVDIVIPVFNEEQALPRSIVILADYLKANLRNPWQIVIADNASTDKTQSVSEMLCERYSGINYLHIPQKGRGRALKAAWLDSTADIVSYMDVDLATDLTHFPQLVESLQEGYHVAIGSRLSKGSRVSRSIKTGGGFPRLQPADQVYVLHTFPRRSMWVQSLDPADRPGHCSSHQKRQLVL